MRFLGRQKASYQRKPPEKKWLLGYQQWYARRIPAFATPLFND
jgi:hypothetical protein